MAEIFNEQRTLGIVIVPDGTLMHNGLPVIGIREAAPGVLFIDNQRVTKVVPLSSGAQIYNDQPVRGAVVISDARLLYNGLRVLPCSGSYETEALALFARFTTPPTDARKGLINSLIKALKAAGVWTKLDALYMLAAADEQAARRNWIQDLYNATAVAAPTFTIDRGYQGNPPTFTFLETGFNPTTAASPKFVLNSAVLGVVSRTDVTDSGQFDIGTTSSRFNCRSTTGPGLRGVMNDATTTNFGTKATSIGMFALNRSAAGARQGYIDGVLSGSDTLASTALANETIQMLRGIFNFSTRELSVGFFGQSLSAPEHAALYSAVQTYLTAVGA